MLKKKYGFNDEEIELIRKMVVKFHSGERSLGIERWESILGIDHQEFKNLYNRLSPKFVSLGVMGRLEVKGELCDAMFEFDHPPVRNLLADIKSWVLSKWWSIPLILIFVVLPMIKGYIELVKFIFDYILGK